MTQNWRLGRLGLSLFFLAMLLAAPFGLLSVSRAVAQEPSAEDKEFQEAYDLLIAKKYAEAAEAFIKLAKKVPVGEQQATSYYNAACAYSLQNDKPKALAVFAQSLRSGFRDVAHFDEDKDLDNIRAEPMYLKLVQMCRDLKFNEIDNLDIAALEKRFYGGGEAPKTGQPWIGMKVGALGAAMRDLLSLPINGLLVLEVAKDSPAEKAGLARLVVVVKLDGNLVTTAEAFDAAIAAKKVGETVALAWLANGKAQSATLAVAAEPSDVPAGPAPKPKVPDWTSKTPSEPGQALYAVGKGQSMMLDRSFASAVESARVRLAQDAQAVCLAALQGHLKSLLPEKFDAGLNAELAKASGAFPMLGTQVLSFSYAETDSGAAVYALVRLRIGGLVLIAQGMAKAALAAAGEAVELSVAEIASRLKAEQAKQFGESPLPSLKAPGTPDLELPDWMVQLPDEPGCVFAHGAALSMNPQMGINMAEMQGRNAMMAVVALRVLIQGDAVSLSSNGVISGVATVKQSVLTDPKTKRSLVLVLQTVTLADLPQEQKDALTQATEKPGNAPSEQPAQPTPAQPAPAKVPALQGGYIGVSLAEAEKGLSISRVSAGSPADKAGLKVGDVVTAINGKPAKTTAQLQGILGESFVGDTLEINLIRDNAEMKVSLVIGKR